MESAQTGLPTAAASLDADNSLCHMVRVMSLSRTTVPSSDVDCSLFAEPQVEVALHD